MLKQSLMAAALLAAISTQAQAATIAADGSWHAFDIDPESGSTGWIDEDYQPLVFEFTLTSSAILRVVDAGFAGDQFDLFNGANFLARTSAATNTYPNSLVLNFDAAFADSNYSRFETLLTPGSYQITGSLFESALDADGLPLDATVGGLSLTAVPLPAAGWLFIAGAGLLGRAARRQTKTGV